MPIESQFEDPEFLFEIFICGVFSDIAKLNAIAATTFSMLLSDLFKVEVVSTSIIFLDGFLSKF